MDSVFQELKHAREARRLSIDDVSDATLINAKFLEAIEQGNTNVLPQTYVRAFIREYASFVGLDPIALMGRYDQANVAQTTPVAKEELPAVEPVPSTPEKREPEEPPKQAPTSLTPVVAKFALPGIVILTLAVALWNVTRTKPPVVKEIPVETMTMPSEPDSGTRATALPQVAPTRPDSLTLRATMSDSVWVQIIIDNLAPQEYLFRPNRKITWRAKERFRINTGNAGAVDLTLNEKHLGAPGKRGAVLRNIEFNRQTLQRK